MYTVLTFVLLLISLAHLKPLNDDMLLFWRRAGDTPCEPFSSYRIACNKCVCAAEGIPYCTRMDCKKIMDKDYSNESS